MAGRIEVNEDAYLGGDLQRLLVILSKADTDGEGIWPRVTVDGVKLYVNCNDLFYWGTADAEEYEPGDEALMQSCFDDLTAADEYGECYLLPLFCCRKRGMRPQYPYFRTYDREARAYTEDKLPPALRALFDALGPDGSDKARG